MNPTAAPAPPARDVAVDAYRGLVMLLMMGEVLRLADVAAALPGNACWAFLAAQQTHVEWAGCSLHDLIQPSFSFLVGVALPFSIASRRARGARFGQLFGHALWRAALLVWLGILLRSLGGTRPNFTFEDTLTQIGLGYPALFLLGWARPRWQWLALGGLLFAYWLAWALWPLPAPGFDWTSVGVPAHWSHLYSGFLAHWNKNANPGQAFDVWFLNLFPRQHPFRYNGGGYLTLNFIPTLGTMVLGLIAGQWVRTIDKARLWRRLVTAGLLSLGAGLALHSGGVCPIVKRIWTPAWTLASGGACLLLLAAFEEIIEHQGWKRWASPLVVVGMNSIAAYLIAHLLGGLADTTVRIHLGALLALVAPAYEPLARGAATLALYWLLLYAMYRRKLWLKI